MEHDIQAPVRGNFVYLRADELRLVLAQDQVGAAEYLDARPQPSAQPGMLRLPGDEEGRVFAALSPRMGLLPRLPEERFVVTTLAGNDDVAWCWSELQVLIDVELRPHALPRVLAAPGMPMSAWVEHAGEMAFLCDARRLQEYVMGRRG